MKKMQAISCNEMLTKHQERFEEINTCKDKHIKTLRLSALMTDMEGAYEIPLIGNLRIEAFKQAYPNVMELYKKASYARCL